MITINYVKLTVPLLFNRYMINMFLADKKTEYVGLLLLARLYTL